MSFPIGSNNPLQQSGQTPRTPVANDDKALHVQTCIRKDIPVSQQKTSSCELMPDSTSEAGSASKRGDAAMYGAYKRNELKRRLEQGGSVVGNTAKGVEADRVLPQRYRLRPERGATVTGIDDMTAGKVRGNPPKPVGADVIRFDKPHGKVTTPHININEELPTLKSLGFKDPHTPISPTTLKATGGAARTLEAFGKVARPVAIVTDTVRLGVAVHADGNTVGKNTAVTAGSVAGGWGGAALGGFIGGIAGGIGGAFLGSAAGETAAEAAVGKP